jgi:hypothetical protein
MDLIEKYRHDMMIRHDKEILSKFLYDFIIALTNKSSLNLSSFESEKFIDSWLEKHYFKSNQEF